MGMHERKCLGMLLAKWFSHGHGAEHGFNEDSRSSRRNGGMHKVLLNCVSRMR